MTALYSTKCVVEGVFLLVSGFDDFFDCFLFFRFKGLDCLSLELRDS